MNILLTASEIISYLFCPRFTYFELYLKIPEHEEKRFKVQKGRELHLEKTKINKEYLRKRIGVVNKEIDVYLASEKLHLKEISMGMSSNYLDAVNFKATYLRIGTKIFGDRN